MFYCKHTTDHLNVLYLQTCFHVSDVCRAGEGRVQWSEVIRLGPAAGVMDSSTDTQYSGPRYQPPSSSGPGPGLKFNSTGAVTRNRTVRGGTFHAAAAGNMIIPTV